MTRIAENPGQTMRAAVVTAPRALSIVGAPIPRPGPGEVRVRLEGTGICASNLPTWQGQPWIHYPRPPGDLGHEGWGRVDALGPGVTGLAVGDRVTGLFGRAYAEYDLAPAAHLVPIPRSLGNAPLPGEPLGCAFNIFHRSGLQRGDTVAIVGIGFLGAILTRLAKDAGARVIAISRRPFSLEVAQRFGADETIPMVDHGKILETVGQRTGSRLCDVVIEAVGKQWPLDLAAELTRERGRLVIAGYHQDGPRQVNMQLWNWRGLDVINAHERDPRRYLDGIREAVDAVAAGRLDPSSLYTHTYPLDALGQAFDAMIARPEGFLKALVTYD